MYVCMEFLPLKGGGKVMRGISSHVGQYGWGWSGGFMPLIIMISQKIAALYAVNDG
jgi:hypothetical protein